MGIIEDERQARLDQAKQASNFLKLLANENRFAILAALAEKNHNVTALVELVGRPQTAVSNQLAKLREAKLVDCEVRHRERLYYLNDVRVKRLLEVMEELFVNPAQGDALD